MATALVGILHLTYRAAVLSLDKKRRLDHVIDLIAKLDNSEKENSIERFAIEYIKRLGTTDTLP